MSQAPYDVPAIKQNRWLFIYIPLMKKALILLALLTVLFSCKKETQRYGDPLIGKWHLRADTLITYNNGVATSTQINPYTNSADHDLEFEATGQFYIYNNVPYPTPPTWAVTGSSLTLTYPAYTMGTATMPATSSAATVRMLDQNRMVLFFQNYTNSGGTTSVQDFVKL